ncbi:hypothetical protein ABIF65_009533 [Bradyrhizobium japonicum]
MTIRKPHFASVILIFFILLLSETRVRSDDAGWIDEPTANTVLPYAYMSRDVSGADARPIAGWTRVADWKTVFGKGGLSADIINTAERSGFSAALYRNNATSELTIAYRETRGLAGWEADIEAAAGRVPAQYNFAAKLATLVKTQYPKASAITATGYSLGGGLATYAAQQSPGITKVLTFNSARPPIVSPATAGRVTQINIVVPGELVGDPNTKSDVGLGSLPGKTYSVRSTTETTAGALAPSQLKSIVTTHKLEGVIGGLEAVKSARADLQGNPPSNTPSGALTGSARPTTGPAQPSSQSPSSRPQATASTNASAPSGAAGPTPSVVQQRERLPASGGNPSPSQVTGFTSLAVAKPGGISLSRAAADRMPLEIALDASALSDGKIVLSGRSSKSQMDAALFLTALRAACDERDPYFSLDPDNGALWSQQGEQASNEFWERIKKDFPFDAPARAKNAQPGVNIRTVSATQHYSGLWHDISPHYPHFRAKLVFYPEWLRQTRLGEVLYKADVLLKELSSGVSILVPGKLRASAIPGYLSADLEYAAKGLLAGTRDQLAVRAQWRGSRLWFEITPSELPITIITETTARPSLDDPALRSLLQSRGLLRSANQSVQNASFFMRHGSVFDLSQVNPIMFVRVHDHATNKDLSDHDPRLDGLATDVSTRFDQYAQYYDELRLLREVFRAYIAARKITEANDRLCGTLDAMPLLDAEKLAARLPDYHPSELFVTIASYSTESRKRSQAQFVKASSMSGGVSIAGQKFAKTAMRDGETTVTRAVEAALAVNLHQPNAIDSDRKFISFIVDDGSGAPVRLASNARDLLAPRSLSDYPIENEPEARANPFTTASSQRNDALFETLAAILIIGLLFSYLVRKRRGARG